jgi:MFS family permease
VFSTVVFFFFGLCAVGRITVCYIYLLEFTPKKRRTVVGTLVSCVNSFIVIEASLYYDYINKDYLYFEIFGISLNVVCVIAMLFMPESAKFLYGKKKFDQARQTFAVIAKMNNVPPFTGVFDTE